MNSISRGGDTRAGTARGGAVTTRCPKCKLEHDRVDVVRWLWLLRDTKPKPPGSGGLILVMLAARMDAKTGCGWTTDPDLAGLAEVASLRTVYAATRWARDRLLVCRARKGYRTTGERGQKSLWILTDPATQGREPTGNRLPHGKAGQPATSNRMGREPTGNLRQANRQSDDDPTGNRLPSIAKPEKLNQEAPSVALRTPGTGSRGRAAATDDDDGGDSSAHPLTRAARDPRTLLGGLGIEDQLTGHILRWLDDRGIGDPFGYLLAIIGRHPDAEDGIRQFLGHRRRELADADRPPRPPKPPWCGECDPDTRQTGLPDHPAWCIRCHPLSVHPPEDSGSSWPPWCGDPDCNPATRWRDTADGLHAGKCPKCHPHLAGSQP
jgi:hypothetical protein